jgi:two-component system cell cycle response regulator DivK
MDGVEALGRLRADPSTAAIPVIAVTAFAMKSDRERLLEAGFDRYVEKPLDIHTLPWQVAAALEQAGATT